MRRLTRIVIVLWLLIASAHSYLIRWGNIVLTRHADSACRDVRFNKETILLPNPAKTRPSHQLKGWKDSLDKWKDAIDDTMDSFLSSRQGDFSKLDPTEQQTYGPGPLIVLYKIPSGVLDDEIQDMVADVAPNACSKGVVLYRIFDNDDALLDETLETSLTKMMMATKSERSLSTTQAASPYYMGADSPVLLFSGFYNSEMMAVYNLLGKEMYEETGGRADPALAKAVANAMSKPLRQVFGEICGDHEESKKVMLE
jgi:hypothetical protein